jgi:chemotaxis protein MotB
VSRRKKGSGDEAEGLRWLTTYGDVVTLLLAFFVLLYAISQVDQRKFRLFVSGLEVPFGNTAASMGGVLSGNSGLADSTNDGNLPANAELTDTDVGLGLIDGGEDLNGGTNTTTTTTTLDTTTTIPIVLPPDDVLRTAEELAALRFRIESELAAAGFSDVVDLDIDTRGLIVAVATDDVLFASGSAEVSPSGRLIVDTLGPALGDIGNPIQVEGHTDSLPLQRFGYDNWNLSTDRAVQVVHRLIVEHGIEPDRLSAVGYGEFRPRADNATEEGRALNRRIELVIVSETE